MSPGGHSIRGIDLSASMVNLAEARKSSLPEDLKKNVSFSAGDVRSIRLGTQFEVVSDAISRRQLSDDKRRHSGLSRDRAASFVSGGHFDLRLLVWPSRLNAKARSPDKAFRNER